MPIKLSEKYRVPEKLTDKSLEEQVKRCVARVSSFPCTVETLLKTISSLQSDPRNWKYRRIDCRSAGYQKVIANIPGAEEFLRAIKFRNTGQYFVVERNALDLDLLEMGIKALKKSKKSPEFCDAMRMIRFNADVQRIRAGVGLSKEVKSITSRPKLYTSQAPSKPATEKGALIQLRMAGSTVSKFFDGDDQLRDIFNWIGDHGSAISDMILSREWCVVDLNRYPVTPISFDSHMEKTLQYIGCWPSGKLELRPSDDDWKLGRESSTIMGLARGLGTAIDAY